MRSTGVNRKRSTAAQSTSLFANMTFKGGTLQIQPSGPNLGEREAMIISREANAAFREHASSLRRFVLDLSSVQQMSSFGLGVCIELRNLAADTAGAPTIAYGLSSTLMDLFRMMRVDRLYTFASSADELEKALAACE